MSEGKLFNLGCPYCHQSLLSSHFIEGLPAIHLKILDDNNTVKSIYLSPEYGNYKVEAETESGLELVEGRIYDFFCPHCGKKLAVDNNHCPECSAPRIKICVNGKNGHFLSLNDGAAIICSRFGCRHSEVYPEAVAKVRDEFLLDEKLQAWKAAGWGWAIF